MFKKFLVLVVILTVIIIPITQKVGFVYAYSGGLLNGQPLATGSTLYNNAGDTLALTDNNTGTGFLIDAAGGNCYVWYRFDGLANITAIKAQSGYIGFVNYGYVNMYDVSGNLIYSNKIANGNSAVLNAATQYSVVANDVKYIVIQNTYTQAMGLNEFDVFGTVTTPTPTPTSTPTPTATLTPMPTDTPTPTLTATATPLPTDTVIPMPTDTPTPLPSDTPTPMPTLTPLPFGDISGRLDAMIQQNQNLLNQQSADAGKQLDMQRQILKRLALNDFLIGIIAGILLCFIFWMVMKE